MGFTLFSFFCYFWWWPCSGLSHSNNARLFYLCTSTCYQFYYISICLYLLFYFFTLSLLLLCSINITVIIVLIIIIILLLLSFCPVLFDQWQNIVKPTHMHYKHYYVPTLPVIAHLVVLVSLCHYPEYVSFLYCLKKVNKYK